MGPRTPVDPDVTAEDVEDAEDEVVAPAPPAKDPEPIEELPPEEFARVRTPNVRNKEIFGIADQLVGGSRIKVNCEDGRARLGRIPGKMKRRMWIRAGDLLIVKPWDFQDDKCDILFRYTRTQAVHLAKRKLVPETINIF